MRKKLFAILMSAMMMVTFMPAMAFAGTISNTDVKWDDDFAGLTYKGVHYAATRALDNASAWSGKMVATCDFSEAGYIDVDGDGNNDTATISYFDLDFAKIAGTEVNGKEKIFTGTTVFNSQNFKNLFPDNANTKLYLEFSVPSYIEGYNSTYKNTKAYPGLEEFAAMDRNFVVATPVYNDKDKYSVQKFTLEPKFDFPANATALKGTKVAPLTIQVTAAEPTIDDMEVLIDGKSFASAEYLTNGNNVVVPYDGSEHVISFATVPTVGVKSIQIYNDKTGTFDTVSEIKAKDVVDDKQYKIVRTLKGVEETTPITFTVKTTASSKDPTVGLTTTTNVKSFEVKDLVKVAPCDDTDEAKKVAAANEELLKAYFNDFYDVKVTAENKDEEKVTYTVAAKDLSVLTGAEKDALIAKYGQLYANFGGSLTRSVFVKTPTLKFGQTGTETYTLVAADIEWTEAPLTVTYKNKKGTLTKNHAINVKATADSKVTYKLSNGGSMIKIDKTTGKITVKKGLKKGTYKVVVKASAKAATDTVSDSYILTIKMAKK